MLGMPSTLTFLFAGFYALRKGIPVARYYLLAISLYLIGLFMIAAVNLGMVPYNLFTRYGYLAGSVFEMVVFSLALGYRFKQNQDEKLDYKGRLLASEITMRSSLERMVNERTEQLKKANQELQELSAKDGLTGLFNRRYFDDAIQREWQRHYRQQSCLSLIMCDIDHFKSYNDRFGHLAGDGCIRKVAQAIERQLLRSGDVAARYGGEEFVIILTETDLSGAYSVAEKIKQAVSDCNILSAVDSHPVVSVSLGVAAMQPDEVHNFLELISRADEALYNSKRSGRNQVSCYQAELRELGCKLVDG
jgi:diguanylate cyclase (GGDEF)-like protein